jgi:PAS domain S-box-containing protein
MPDPCTSENPEAPSGPDEPFQDMASHIPAMLWVTDRENHCTFLSRQWCEYTGQSPEEGFGFGWLDAVHPQDREETTRRFLERAERREPMSLDHRLRRRDGEYRWVVDEGRPRFGPEGEWLGYVGSVVDVHDRKLATEALRASERKYRTLFESIDEGFCVIEVLFEGQRPVDYRFVEGNPAWEKHTGLTGAVGRTAREVLPELEEHWFIIYGSVALTGEPRRFQSGSEVMQRWFDVFAFRVEEPEKRRVALLFTDISDRKRAEIEREALLRDAEEARAEAEAANQSKSGFLAAMSHELRTPLNAIGGYVDLLSLGVYGPLNGRQRSALQRIDTNQGHLLTLINDILSFARMEVGRIELDIGSLSAAEVLSGVESLVAPQAVASGVRYRVEPCDAGLRLRGDAERVRQVLINLVSNALKFTPSGGEVVLSCGPADGAVDLRVRDTGVGIPAAEQERIFDAFQQVGRRLSRPTEGVGLGLAISRDLARSMGGDLTVESEPGRGSTFTLRLPAANG